MSSSFLSRGRWGDGGVGGEDARACKYCRIPHAEIKNRTNHVYTLSGTGRIKRQPKEKPFGKETACVPLPRAATPPPPETITKHRCTKNSISFIYLRQRGDVVTRYALSPPKHKRQTGGTPASKPRAHERADDDNKAPHKRSSVCAGLPRSGRRRRPGAVLSYFRRTLSPCPCPGTAAAVRRC